MRGIHGRALHVFIMILVMSAGDEFARADREERLADSVAVFTARLAGEAEALCFETGRAVGLRPQQRDDRLEALLELRSRAAAFMRLTRCGCEEPHMLRQEFDAVDEAWKHVTEILPYMPRNSRSRRAAENVDDLMARLGGCMPEPAAVDAACGRDAGPLSDITYAIKREGESLLYRTLNLEGRSIDRHDRVSVERLLSRLGDVARIADLIHDDVVRGRDVRYPAGRMIELNRHFNAAWRLRDDCAGSDVSLNYERLGGLIDEFARKVGEAETP